MKRISRRQLIQTASAAGLLMAAKVDTAAAVSGSKVSPRGPSDSSAVWDPSKIGGLLMRDPIWVYDNWSAYTDQHGGGVSPLDRVRLTEALAMRELREVVRLKSFGVHFDYYMMNAYWFAPDGAYRKWRQPDWPDGPDRWIEGCQQNGLKPGLWFGTNALTKKIHAVPGWHDSIDPKPEGEPTWMSFFEGGFLADFMEALQYWYDRGIRMFELDFANFDAATAAGRKAFSPQEIRERNQTALRNALHAFRRKNSDTMLAAFNDFGGDIFEPTSSPFPFKKPVDLRWLEVFDTLYCGDVQVSDVPQVTFWRSVDLYCDHMVRRYEQSGVPLERIDTFSTFSTTWFGYNRQLSAWKGMLLLTAARGGWKNTVYGSLELLSEEHARWFAKLQKTYAPLQAMGRTKTFGGIPGEVQPYGFCSFDTSGASKPSSIRPRRCARSTSRSCHEYSSPAIPAESSSAMRGMCQRSHIATSRSDPVR